MQRRRLMPRRGRNVACVGSSGFGVRIRQPSHGAWGRGRPFSRGPSASDCISDLHKFFHWLLFVEDSSGCKVQRAPPRPRTLVACPCVHNGCPPTRATTLPVRSVGIAPRCRKCSPSASDSDVPLCTAFATAIAVLLAYRSVHEPEHLD